MYTNYREEELVDMPKLYVPTVWNRLLSDQKGAREEEVKSPDQVLISVSDMNELETLSFVCKQKHMLKKGAPSNEFGDVCRTFPIESFLFYNRIDFLCYNFWFGVLFQFLKIVLLPFISKLVRICVYLNSLEQVSTIYFMYLSMWNF